MFEIHTSFAVKSPSQARACDRELYIAAGRKSDIRNVDTRRRYHTWLADTFYEAVALRRNLEWAGFKARVQEELTPQAPEFVGDTD